MILRLQRDWDTVVDMHWRRQWRRRRKITMCCTKPIAQRIVCLSFGQLHLSRHASVTSASFRDCETALAFGSVWGAENPMA
jgi:hypothetical protein